MSDTPEIAAAKRMLEDQATELPNWARQLLDYIAEVERARSDGAKERAALNEKNVQLRFEVNDMHGAMLKAKKGLEDQCRVNERLENDERELRAYAVTVAEAARGLIASIEPGLHMALVPLAAIHRLSAALAKNPAVSHPSGVGPDGTHQGKALAVTHGKDSGEGVKGPHCHETCTFEPAELVIKVEGYDCIHPDDCTRTPGQDCPSCLQRWSKPEVRSLLQSCTKSHAALLKEVRSVLRVADRSAAWRAERDRVVAAIDAALAECHQVCNDARDAERYRWLVQNCHLHEAPENFGRYTYSKTWLDGRVDECMARHAKGEVGVSNDALRAAAQTSQFVACTKQEGER